MRLLEDVEAHYCVDLGRVYAAGISLGAWKAAVTACAHPDRFAAIALVAVEVAPSKCAMPVVAFHGTADTVVPYGDGADPGVVVTGSNAGLPGAAVNMAHWSENDGCGDKRVERIGDDVERWVYEGCRRGLGVEFYSIAHGGHTWPGSPIDVGRLGKTTHTIDATQISLDWFAAHARRG
jgi:polyhydroxybutyrate depolymerase